MGSIGRYIFRSTLGAFTMVLISLTAIIWITQALRDLDIMTAQGQTVLVFVGITSLIIPQLVVVLAPVAFLVAVTYVLNKLAADSEIVVMNSAGMSPWRLFRPFFSAALLVSALVVVLTVYLAPRAMRELTYQATAVRADFVTNIVQPGIFTTIEPGLTFHIRARGQNNRLQGIFVDDQRDRKEHSTYLAEDGQILQNEKGTFLVLETGMVQRQSVDQPDPTFVHFDNYPFDLSRFVTGFTRSSPLSVREVYLWDLAFPGPANPTLLKEPGQFRAEFHDRVMAALYPMAFTVIVFMYLGAPRTTRQGSTLATLAMIGAIVALRATGFVSTVVGIFSPWALAFQYIALITLVWIGLRSIRRGIPVEPPRAVTEWFTAVSSLITRRFAPS